MKSFPFAVLVACAVAGAAVPTSNLCEDEQLFFNSVHPIFPWRLDSAYFAESPPGHFNDWSWKYRYSGTTGYPTSITVDFLEGEGPKTYAFAPMEGGFYSQFSEGRIEHHSFQTRADTLVHTMWASQNDTLLDSARVLTWSHGRFGLHYEEGFVDTIKSFWSGDTFFDMDLPSRARSTSSSTYYPSIDTCFALSQDECACHRAPYSYLSVRTAWDDGFKITKSKLDSSNGNDINIRFYRPLSVYTSVKRRAKGSLGIRPAETFRWNGARSPGSSTSANPLEHLRHGQIPPQTPQRP